MIIPNAFSRKAVAKIVIIFEFSYILCEEFWVLCDWWIGLLVDQLIG